MIKARTAATICPITVATAAPATPIAGSPKYPKIRIGSRMILMIAPVPWVNMVNIVFPVDCSSLSKINCAYIPKEKQHTTVRYSYP